MDVIISYVSKINLYYSCFFNDKANMSEVNSHLFMNSDSSDYIFFHKNYDPPGEYQLLIILFTWLEGVVLKALF